MTRLFFTLLSVVLLICIGCGGPRAQVTGKVVFDDGSPVTVGDIRGKAEDVEVRGSIGADGSFSFFEVKPGDGIPAGLTYTVWLVNTNERVPSTEKVRDDEGNMVPKRDQFVSRISDEFKGPTKSPLSLQVPKGTKSLTADFTVKKP